MTRFCTHCGQAVPDNCSFCTNCGAPLAAGSQPQYQVNINSQPNPQPQYAGPKPNSYMVWSILATLFCCIPLGIWCIVCSSKVNKAWQMGNFYQAKSESDKAKKWIIITAIVGLVANVAAFFSSGALQQYM